MRSALLWKWSSASGPAQLVPEPLTEPVHFPRCFTPQGAAPRENGLGAAREVVLLPVDALDGGARGRLSAVLLVPDGCCESVRLAGARVAAGMHPVRHGDRLDLAGHELWVSTLCSGTEEPYGPEHGPDRHCFRVKAKLKAGEPVVLCPGVPHAACGVLYKAAAWRTVPACSNCGHEPDAPAWAPPGPARGMERRSLRELFARAARLA